MDTKINYVNNKKIELIGELDPDVELTDVCLNGIVEHSSVTIKTSVPMNLKDLENFFRWAGTIGTNKWEGKWKMTLERIE